MSRMSIMFQTNSAVEVGVHMMSCFAKETSRDIRTTNRCHTANTMPAMQNQGKLLMISEISYLRVEFSKTRLKKSWYPLKDIFLIMKFIWEGLRKFSKPSKDVRKYMCKSISEDKL